MKIVGEMNLTLDEMLKFCRLCQLKPGVYKLLTDNLSEQIFECTNIKIKDESLDTMPSTVCEECTNLVRNFFDYLQKIRKVDTELRKIIGAKVNADVAQPEFEHRIGCSTQRGAKCDLKIKSDCKRFKCPVCLKSYARFTNLQSHKRNHSTLFCFTCEVIFDDTCEKIQHTCKTKELDVRRLDGDTATGAGASCDDIETVNDSNNARRKASEKEIHLEQNFSDSGVRSNSEVTETFSDHEILKDEEKSKGSFKCTTCNKEFVWRIDLWLHKKNHQTNLMCRWENCNKICKSAYVLKTHEMKHEGKRPFLCVTCGKGFVTKNSLNCHEKIHLEVKAYVCKLCNIGFSVRSNLRAHEKKYHEGVRFYCSKCTRAYISKSSLERHERLHTGIREFQCESCPSAFYTNKELVKHQRYHQGIKQHKCDQCFKSFFEKHHLTIHLRSHTGERPYVCRITGCGKSFTESQKLTRHLKARHPPHI